MDAERTERIIMEILRSSLPDAEKLDAIKATFQSYKDWAERRYW